ncbi:46 kDa FK506-binding nuclear protein [Athalia rosae]|uniref:46 kDa FK506-binding nuclear protein n=1 Tax=Athalia rosae TaxID=37344 RepID=UPI002033ADA1|nr:46 kDa FK506-binding nuclear protein [Athalia rosae]
MFWGLIMEPNKRYTQTVEKSFHVSMASLDVPSAGTGAVEVMLTYENRNYLLCTLQPGLAIQVPLDLNFVEGTEIAFASSGTGRVHLTGYLAPDDDLDLDELEEEEEDDVEAPQLVEKQSKRKSSDLDAQGQRDSKRAKHDEEEEESSDDDDDFAEEDSDSDDKDGEFEDEDLIEGEGDSEEEEEEVELEEVVKPLSKKQKQKLRQQQQQEAQPEQKTKKQEKLVNGKDSKQDQKQKKQKGEQQQSQENKQEPKKRTVAGGVKIEDLQVGTGAVAKAGKHLAVYYIGRLQNGKKFDAVSRGDGFKFRIGKNEVIQGWDVGITGMKVGGKRRITIPPALAYGARGSPPVIPPNSTLVFEVELKNVR